MNCVRHLQFPTRNSLTRFSKLSYFLHSQTRLSSSDLNPTTPSVSNTFDITRVSELISKQHWSDLKALFKPLNPKSFLQLLFDYEADSEVILAFFKWSQHGYHVSYSLDHYCKLFHLLANAKKYGKIRALLHIFVKESNSCSSIFHTLSMSSDRFCANSVIVDMLILAYVKNSNTALAFEAFERAGDYGFKLSIFSCNPLLNSLVKESKFWVVEFMYKEMVRRRIELNLISFNTVINGLCKVGKSHKAGDVEDTKVWGFEPSVVSGYLYTLIGGYCKIGRVGKMYKSDAVLKEMVSNNNPVYLIFGNVPYKL